MIISARMHGGLGNQLFQQAAAYHLAKVHDADFYISKYRNQISKHSERDYTFNVFGNFKLTHRIPDCFIKESAKDCMIYNRFNLPAESRNHAQIIGYFQSERYVDESFCLQLDFGEKLESLKKTCFIHIRLGDYVNHPIHWIDLNQYYERAIRITLDHYRDDVRFIVISNDPAKAKQSKFLNGISNITYSTCNEIDDMRIMMNCEYGGICANSSYSWWGAKLNNHANAIFFQPKRWLNNDWTCEIHLAKAKTFL